MLHAALAWLKASGARVAQSLLCPDEVVLAESLRRHNFTNPTRLWHLRHKLDCPPELLSAPGELAFVSYRDCSRDSFHEVLARSHQQTQDFPELNGLRSLADVLQGQQSTNFDPGRWWLASAGGVPVGVLMMAQADEPDEWELSYVGVIPAARQRGWGSELVRQRW